ncbi:MAG TPA: hypothetical protein VFX59_23865, partial [Polyangiales bacterium]|nr:hypothetical protein [Polyangiales bacterium]
MRTTRITGLEQLWVTRARSTQVRAEQAATERTSTQVRISEQADLLKRMSALQQSDPDRFKEVLGSVSQNLTAASQNPEAGQVNGELSKLARSLDRVARTGDLRRMDEPVGLQTTHRAIEAYLKNARPTPQTSETSRQALQYVLSTLAEANQEVAPAEATDATR